MKNVTSRQVAALVVLVFILIIVIAVQYFFRPLIKQKNELSEQIESMQYQYDDIKMNDSCYQADVSVYHRNKKSLEDQRIQLLPLMKSNELDKMMTKIFIENGLVIQSLEISEIKADLVSIPYKNTDDDTDKDDENNENITDKNDDEYDLSEYPDGADIVLNKNENVMVEYKTGEYSCELNYTVSGTYKNILDLVKEISTDKSLQISSFYFINKDTVSADCIYQADIGVTAYMYDVTDDSGMED